MYKKSNPMRKIKLAASKITKLTLWGGLGRPTFDLF